MTWDKDTVIALENTKFSAVKESKAIAKQRDRHADSIFFIIQVGLDAGYLRSMLLKEKLLIKSATHNCSSSTVQGTTASGKWRLENTSQQRSNSRVVNYIEILGKTRNRTKTSLSNIVFRIKVKKYNKQQNYYRFRQSKFNLKNSNII